MLPTDREPTRPHGPSDAALPDALIDRRGVLTWAGAAAGALLLPRSFARAAAVDAGPFSLGVAAGDPVPDGFVIWTRLAPEPLAPDGLGGMGGPVKVRWQVAEDEAMKHVVRSGEATADAKFAHSVHVEVDGLKPFRPYFYRFMALGAESATGRARTAPAADALVDRIRFAFASCSHYEEGLFTAYRRMADENPDFVVFLGDYIYEYNNQGNKLKGRPRRHDMPEAVDLPTYRTRYALYRTDPDLQALHASAACLMTWDDHEVENDYADQWSAHPDVPVDAFLKRRAAAYRAFYEHMPLRRSSMPNGPDMKVYDRLSFGRLLDMPILDGRQYRDMGPCPLPNWRGGHVVPLACKERDEASRTMLGMAQERWLFDGFNRSTARWNVVAQDLLMASLLQQGKDGTVGHWTDAWDGYPACRTRVLDAVQKTRLSNPVFIGGDIHSFWTTDLKADFSDPDSRTVATEFVGGSITADAPSYALFAKFLPENPHVRYFESRAHGYVSVDVRPERLEAHFRNVDRIDPLVPMSTLKSFVVENGRAGAIDA